MKANAPALMDAYAKLEDVSKKEPTEETAYSLKTVVENLPHLLAACCGGSADHLEASTLKASIDASQALARKWTEGTTPQDGYLEAVTGHIAVLNLMQQNLDPTEGI